MTDTDIRYYRSCIYSVYSVMRNNMSVSDHVTTLSCQSLSLGLPLSRNEVMSTTVIKGAI